MSTVVVGAGGFLGSHLVSRLTAAGTPVTPVTRDRPSTAAGARVVFYVATSVNPGLAERRPDLVDADCEAFRQLLGGLRETRPLVVFTSSATNYDPAAPGPYREDDPLRTSSSYGLGKLRMERILLEHADVVRPVIVRLASMYGPGHRTDPGHGVIAHWLTSIALGEPLRIIGPDDVSRDFVYVSDVVDALIRIPSAHRPVPPVLNIGSGEAVSLARLYKEMCAVTGTTPVVQHEPARGFDRDTLSVHIGRAAGVLGWRPATSLAEGLARTWAAIRPVPISTDPVSTAGDDRGGRVAAPFVPASRVRPVHET